MANDFSGDANCIALWRFENGALTTDSQGSNTLTNTGVTADTVNYQEGAAAGDWEYGDSDDMAIDDGDLSSGFPLKSTEVNRTFSICYWVRLETISPSWKYINWSKEMTGWSTGTSGYFLGTNYFFYLKRTTQSVSVASTGTGLSATTGVWYHIGLSHNDNTGELHIRIYDSSNTTVYDNTATHSPATYGDVIDTDTPFYLGRMITPDTFGRRFDGQMDEFVVFNDILTNDEIDQIRSGTYVTRVPPETPSTPPASTSTLTVYAANSLLNHYFNKATYVSPTIYVGLLSSDGTEVSGGAYARIQTSPSDWSSAAAGVVSNLSAFAFETPTSLWGVVSRVGLYDASSGGNLLWWGSLDTPRDCVSGLASIQFDIGSIVGRAGGCFMIGIINAFMDHLFGKATMSQISECWVGIADTDGYEPTDSGSGYIRKRMLPADWNSASNGNISNAGNIVFDQPNSAWGVMTATQLWSTDLDDSAEEILWSADFIQSRDITAVDAPPEYLAGRLRIKFV